MALPEILAVPVRNNAAPSGCGGVTNHRPPRGSVTAGYIDISMEHLAECQERVSRFLMDRIKGKPTPKKATRRPIEGLRK